MLKKFIELLNRLIGLFYTERFINNALLILTIFLLTLLLSSRYFLFQNIIKNGVSRSNIKASQEVTVEDDEMTDTKRRYESLKVKPILIPVEDNTNEVQRTKLGETISSIIIIRNSNEPNSVKQEKLKKLFDVKGSNYYINTSINSLYLMNELSFIQLANESLTTMDKILFKGVTEADLLDDKDEIIKAFTNPSLNQNQKTIVYLLVNKNLLPNMEEDKSKTEQTIQKVISEVKPVMKTYKRGDLIVSVGEKVTKVQKEALKVLGYNINQFNLIGVLGILSLVGLCIFTMVYYLYHFENKYIKTSYVALISLLTIIITAFAVMLPSKEYIYVVPIPAIAMLLSIFTTSRIALLNTTLVIVMLGVSLQYDIEYIFVFMLGAIIAIFTSNSVNYYRRMDMIRAGFDVGLIQMFVTLVMFLLHNNSDNLDISSMVLKMFFGFGNGLLSGIIALGFLPLVESTFKIITPYGLAELADHNQALLRRLQFEAPGTYHHSLMVSNLCEAASEAIGANPILTRVGAFYHDIGKLKRPLFFIENQAYFGIENPHEKLNPRLSKMVITAHPKDGVELAKEYGLPSIIHQFIIQHHGDGLAAYFYKQALEAEGAENITEEQFRYNNPKPSTKEAAILMMADAVESAVRSLKNPAPEEVDEMVDKIVKERLIDGQLSDSPLTQKDIKTVSNVFKRALRGMQHHRIKYHEDIIEELNRKNGLKHSQMKNEIDNKIIQLMERSSNKENTQNEKS